MVRIQDLGARLKLSHFSGTHEESAEAPAEEKAHGGADAPEAAEAKEASKDESNNDEKAKYDSRAIDVFLYRSSLLTSYLSLKSGFS